MSSTILYLDVEKSAVTSFNCQLGCVLLHELYRLMLTKMAESFVVGFVRNLYPITLTAVIALPGF